MIRYMAYAISVLTFASVSFADIPAPATSPDSGQNTILRCQFREEGGKGWNGRQCRAEYSAPPSFKQNDATRGSSPSSPNNRLTIVCDGKTVYDAGAFTGDFEVGGKPEFGFSVVTAINGHIMPDFPAIWVDADFLDTSHSFHDVDSRLRFNKDFVIHGVCSHDASVIP